MEDRSLAPTVRPRTGFGPISPRVALVIIGAAIVGAVLYLGRGSLGPFIVGLILAYLIDIPVGRLARAGLPRWLAVLVVYVVVALAIYQGLRVMLRPLAEEVATFISELPAFSAQLSDQYAHLDLPPALRQAIDGALKDLGSGIGSIDPGSLLPVATVFAGVLGAVVAYIIVPVWAFYLLKDRPALAAAARRSLPEPWRADVAAVSGLVFRVFGQWMRGQLFLGLTVGIATFAGLTLLSVTVDPVFGRFAIFLSVIAGIFELLPIIGPILSAIPAILLALTAGPQAALAALVLYVIVQQVENNVLVPKIQGDAVELHPTIVMVALIVGGSIGGLLGAILALPITAASRDVFRYAFHRVDEPPATPDEALAIIRARPTIVDDEAPGVEPAGVAAPAAPAGDAAASPVARPVARSAPPGDAPGP
ncbi:MAG TPA: AI-2E family transporter [Candidatus Limnocylindrales bacterium]|nr:AI-2E family transporter [Candidatus Limnocylindrales bacterium]